MRVVELDGRLLGQRPPVRIRLAEPADDVGERAGNEEIFLQQSKSAPLRGVIVGIKNTRQRLRIERFDDRCDERNLRAASTTGRPI